MNEYLIASYPSIIEFGVFSEITLNDLEEHQVKILISAETSKSIRLSIYCNRKNQGINSKVLPDVSYLERTKYNWATGRDIVSHFIKVTKKQSGDNLVEIIKKQVDRILGEVKNPILLCFKRDVLMHI